ncbi:hypothetical protein DQ226_18400 [Dietzia maris]|uniref:Uncharacterized protein n=1 Tax=Dietzia maris TaxID=37915 RepID=A0A365P4T6_9ACTN|nr:hypothetical protein DQ226_18400 [Dietzia maris]
MGGVRGREFPCVALGGLEQAEQGIGAVGDRGQGTAAGDCEPGDSGGRDGELTAREGDGGGMGHSDILPGVGEGGGEAVQ